MKPNSLSFLTLINKGQSHLVEGGGGGGVFVGGGCFLDTRTRTSVVLQNLPMPVTYYLAHQDSIVKVVYTFKFT